MTKETPPRPLDSRQYFCFLRAKFGAEYLGTKFQISGRTMDRWTADTKYVCEESIRKNPIEKLEETMADLIDRGYACEARALVARFARLVGLAVEVVTSCPSSLAETLDGELLETYPAVCRFHQSVRDGDDLEIAEHWLEQARRELDEDFARYCQEWPRGGLTTAVRQRSGRGARRTA